MKIEFDEYDKKSIEKYRNHELFGSVQLPLPFISENQEKCSIELKINDPYKCAVFLSELFYSLRDHTKNELGFEVSAVSLIGVYSDLQKLDDSLHEAINEAIKKHNI